MIPSDKKTPHDDSTSQELRIRIAAAAKLMERRDLSPKVRVELLIAIRNAWWALEQYRYSIGTGGDGPHINPTMATTTTNPVSALGALLMAMAVVLTAAVTMPDPRGRPSPAAEALADALRRLAEPIKTIELGEELTPEPEPGPTKEVFPTPDLDPEPRQRRKRTCVQKWGPPAGGDAIHDEYSHHVAERHGDPGAATMNYFVVSNGLAVDFDHYHAEANEYFEVKTRHEILMHEWARNQPLVVARILVQATRQNEILVRCAEPGWQLIWYFDDPEVVEAATGFLGSLGIEVRHEPWPRGERPERP